MIHRSSAKDALRSNLRKRQKVYSTYTKTVTVTWTQVEHATLLQGAAWRARGYNLTWNEIKLFHPKGNQPWIFTGSTDAEAETTILWSPDTKTDSLGPHGLQHSRLPCPSPTPGAYSNSCPLSWWWHPTISSSVVPFSFHLQSFSASRSFPMSQFFASGGQNIGVSASASVLPMNIQDWSPLGLTGWISLLSKGLSRVFSNTTVQS